MNRPESLDSESLFPFSSRRQDQHKKDNDLESFKHPRVHTLADRFRMGDLKKVPCKKFELQLPQHWIK